MSLPYFFLAKSPIPCPPTLSRCTCHLARREDDTYCHCHCVRIPERGLLPLPNVKEARRPRKEEKSSSVAAGKSRRERLCTILQELSAGVKGCQHGGAEVGGKVEAGDEEGQRKDSHALCSAFLSPPGPSLSSVVVFTFRNAAEAAAEGGRKAFRG